MPSFSFLLVLILGVFLQSLRSELQAAKDDERKPSVFKVGEEWLALPEVFSNLDFTADSAPATEADVEGQNKLRSTRFWGRLYIDGWPQTIQFFRAHFGIAPPRGKKIFVFSEPRDACSELTNAHMLTSDHVLLVNRGACTYGTKAKFAQKTNASAIVIINNEPGLDHLPGPDAHDIQFSVSSIPQQEGQLLEAVYDEGPSSVEGGGGGGRLLEGYMVPINCENSGSRCVPATYEERSQIKGLVEGGTLQVTPAGSLKEGDLPIEYLLAHFGSKVTHDSISLPLIVARPAEACTPIENNIKGKVVIVRRGGCPFVKKAEEVQAAGGRVLVMGSLHPHIVRMGVEPRWKGLNTAIPVVMVSKRAYSIMVAESYAGGNVAFSENAAVNSTVWEHLEKLNAGEGWKRSDSFIAKQYQELLEEHAAWPDRILSITDSHNKKLAGATTAAQTQGASKEKEEL